MTASGKSALAHKIAIERNLDINSLDSMAVYKGLDILTDKPTEVMRSQVLYYGIDIADTDPVSYTHLTLPTILLV